MLILALLAIVLAGTQTVNLVDANPTYIKPLYSRIIIQSPQNTTYSEISISLNFTVETNLEESSYPYFYLLDGQDGKSSVKIEDIQLIAQRRVSDDISPYERNTIPWAPYIEYTLKGQAVLPHLSDGEHNLTVFMGANWVINNQTSANPFFSTVNFGVDTSSVQTSQESQPKSLPATLIIATVASATVVGMSLVVYVGKVRKGKAE
jgi:hypothetical protein